MREDLQNPSNFLTVAELMAATKESESAWRKRLARREIPFIKLGSSVRVRREDLEAFLENRTVRA